ncbi:MAG: 5-(carboxyamino)imidazole ribonucleotide mutase [Chloroflexota bacterium]
MATQALVGVIMGSDSDLPTMRDAIDILKEFDIPHEVKVVSAHRTPDDMADYAKSAHERGLKVIIAGAGGAAHLPGMVAAYTPLPVIGVPVKSSALSGIDSLLSIVQMPNGVPVATVAIGKARNAGLLAVKILATADDALLTKMQQYRADLAKMSRAKNDGLDV